MRRGRGIKPQALSLEITQRCVAKCVMCNIRRVPRTTRALSLDDWLRLLAASFFSDLRELDVTGGEPFLFSDLAEFFAGLGELGDRNFKGLRSIAITTNR